MLPVPTFCYWADYKFCIQLTNSHCTSQNAFGEYLSHQLHAGCIQLHLVGARVTNKYIALSQLSRCAFCHSNVGITEKCARTKRSGFSHVLRDRILDRPLEGIPARSKTQRHRWLWASSELIGMQRRICSAGHSSGWRRPIKGGVPRCIFISHTPPGSQWRPLSWWVPAHTYARTFQVHTSAVLFAGPRTRLFNFKYLIRSALNVRLF